MADISSYYPPKQSGLPVEPQAISMPRISCLAIMLAALSTTALTTEATSSGAGSAKEGRTASKGKSDNFPSSRSGRPFGKQNSMDSWPSHHIKHIDTSVYEPRLPTVDRQTPGYNPQGVQAKPMSFPGAHSDPHRPSFGGGGGSGGGRKGKLPKEPVGAPAQPMTSAGKIAPAAGVAAAPGLIPGVLDAPAHFDVVKPGAVIDEARRGSDQQDRPQDEMCPVDADGTRTVRAEDVAHPLQVEEGGIRRAKAEDVAPPLQVDEAQDHPKIAVVAKEAPKDAPFLNNLLEAGQKLANDLKNIGAIIQDAPQLAPAGKVQPDAARPLGAGAQEIAEGLAPAVKVQTDVAHPLQVEATETHTRKVEDLAHPDHARPLQVEAAETRTVKAEDLAHPDHVHPLQVEAAETHTRKVEDLAHPDHAHPLQVEATETRTRKAEDLAHPDHAHPLQVEAAETRTVKAADVAHPLQMEEAQDHFKITANAGNVKSDAPFLTKLLEAGRQLALDLKSMGALIQDAPQPAHKPASGTYKVNDLLQDMPALQEVLDRIDEVQNAPYQVRSTEYDYLFAPILHDLPELKHFENKLDGSLEEHLGEMLESKDFTIPDLAAFYASLDDFNARASSAEKEEYNKLQKDYQAAFANKQYLRMNEIFQSVRKFGDGVALDLLKETHVQAVGYDRDVVEASLKRHYLHAGSEKLQNDILALHPLIFRDDAGLGLPAAAEPIPEPQAIPPVSVAPVAALPVAPQAPLVDIDILRQVLAMVEGRSADFYKFFDEDIVRGMAETIPDIGQHIADFLAPKPAVKAPYTSSLDFVARSSADERAEYETLKTAYKDAFDNKDYAGMIQVVKDAQKFGNAVAFDMLNLVHLLSNDLETVKEGLRQLFFQATSDELANSLLDRYRMTFGDDAADALRDEYDDSKALLNSLPTRSTDELKNLMAVSYPGMNVDHLSDDEMRVQLEAYIDTLLAPKSTNMSYNDLFTSMGLGAPVSRPQSAHPSIGLAAPVANAPRHFESFADLNKWGMENEKNFTKMRITTGVYNKAAEDYYDARRMWKNDEVTLAKLRKEAREARNSIEAEFGVNPAFELFNMNLLGMHSLDKSSDEIWYTYQEEILAIAEGIYGTTLAMAQKIAEQVDKIFGLGEGAKLLGLRDEHIAFRNQGIAALRDKGYSAEDILRANFSAKELKDAGFTASELKGASYGATELKGVGFTVSELKDTGFTLSQLKDAEFTVSELNDVGFTLSQLKDAEFTALELNDIGFTLSQLKDVEFTAFELKNAGFTVLELKDSGFTASQLKDAEFLAFELQIAGFTALELRDAGFSAKMIYDAGYDLSELKDAGFTPKGLAARGQTIENLRGVGFTDDEILTANFEAKAYKDAGFTATQIADAGYDVGELKDAGFTPAELGHAGYSIDDLSNAGFTDDEILTANFEAQDYKNAGFTATQVADAGYDLGELKVAGFTPAELGSSGYVIDDLRNAGFTDDEILTANFEAQDYKGAGFTAEQVANAGYTKKELEAAGYKVTFPIISDVRLQELHDEIEALFGNQLKVAAEKRTWEELTSLYRKYNDAFKADDRQEARKIRTTVADNVGMDLAADLLTISLLKTAQGMSPQEKGAYLRNAYEEEILLESSEEMVKWICQRAEKALSVNVADELWAKYQDRNLELSPAPVGPSDQTLLDLLRDTEVYIATEMPKAVARLVEELINDDQLRAVIDDFSNKHKAASERNDKVKARAIRGEVEENSLLGVNFSSYLLNSYLVDAAQQLPEIQRHAFLHNALEEEVLAEPTSSAMVKKILQSAGRVLGEDEAEQLRAKLQSRNPAEDVVEASPVSDVSDDSDKAYAELPTSIGFVKKASVTEDEPYKVGAGLTTDEIEKQSAMTTGSSTTATNWVDQEPVQPTRTIDIGGHTLSDKEFDDMLSGLNFADLQDLSSSSTATDVESQKNLRHTALQDAIEEAKKKKAELNDLSGPIEAMDVESQKRLRDAKLKAAIKEAKKKKQKMSMPGGRSKKDDER